ncbi:MAG: HipA N-terminal domain-containing protein [Acidobacteria bacterium]|nr:HipA N-terminal domain-containing protein [Acidobacteriota bacterium]
MKLNVHVLANHVAVLEQVGDFKCVMAYVPDVAPGSLVSLTMPVRTESHAWDDELHPFLRMNLPEGYLRQVLQEEFGPHIGASPVALLSVIGRNMGGRLKVAPPGAALEEPAKPIEVAELLKGDNSEEAFSELVRHFRKAAVCDLRMSICVCRLQPKWSSLRRPNSPRTKCPCGASVRCEREW